MKVPSECTASAVKYRTIAADPPWPYDTSRALPKSFKRNSTIALGGGAEERYPLMSLADLCALRPPVADDAHLYLWTTNAFMEKAHGVARAWGFQPKTICTWGKVQPNGRPSMKVGYWFRGATEHCIFAVRGSLPFPAGIAEPTLWLWPRLPHSVKPGAFYDLVERVSPAPRLELFARTQRLGWETWGDECLTHVDLDHPEGVRR
jgi:N6-adenosine-specific RNA methylase IME4